MKKSLYNKKRGTILMMTYLIVALLLTFGSIFVMRAFNDINAAELKEKRAKAFWAAEAVAALAESYIDLNIALPTEAIDVGNGAFASIESIESTASTCEVIVKGQYGTGDDPIIVYLKDRLVAKQFDDAVEGEKIGVKPVILGGGSLVFLGPKGGRTSFGIDASLNPTATVTGQEYIENLSALLTEPKDAPNYRWKVVGDEDGDDDIDRTDFISYRDQVIAYHQASNPDTVVTVDAEEGSELSLNMQDYDDANIKIVNVRTTVDPKAATSDAIVTLQGKMPEYSEKEDGNITFFVDGAAKVLAQKQSRTPAANLTVLTPKDTIEVWPQAAGVTLTLATSGSLDIQSQAKKTTTYTLNCSAEEINFYLESGRTIQVAPNTYTAVHKQPPAGLYEPTPGDHGLLMPYFEDPEDPEEPPQGGGGGGGGGGPLLPGHGVEFCLQCPYGGDGTNSFMWESQWWWENIDASEIE